jgi:hypothetical protein
MKRPEIHSGWYAGAVLLSENIPVIIVFFALFNDVAPRGADG